MMSTLFILLGALVAGVLGKIVPDEDEYTLQAIEELRHMSSARLLSDITEPTCTDQKKPNSFECTLNMKWMNQKTNISIELGFNMTRVQINFALLFNGTEVIKHPLNVGQICAPLPGLLEKINICIHAYYVEINVDPKPINFTACFLIKLGGFFHLKFNCIELDKDGKFSQHSRIQPESKGILVLSLEDGNVKFDLNNPIPDEVMKKIEEGWNILGDETGKLVDKAGKEITDVANKVEDELTGVTNLIKDTVVDEFNKVTAGIGSIGDTISGWFG